MNYKLLQFVLALCIGLVMGYLADKESAVPVPETTDSQPKQSITDESSTLATDNEYQQSLETEVEQLRNRVVFLEQQLSEQQADDTISADDSQSEIPTEKLTVENLMKSGVSEMMAQDIVDRISQYEYQLLELHDRAAREGYLNSPRYARERRELMETSPSLRNAIGNDSYDRYLYATGQNNRVVVASVMSESPADLLGVQKDDIILTYANEKILSWHDLRKLTSQGAYGEYVNLNILRDGQLINILVPRGPLGVKLGTTLLDPEIQYNY